MKSLKWAAAFGAVAVGVILYLNKDDVLRYQKMRQSSTALPRAAAREGSRAATASRCA